MRKRVKKQIRALDKKRATLDRCNSEDEALFIYDGIAKQCHHPALTKAEGIYGS